MIKNKVIQVLYSGLGGHGNVVFPLLESEFGVEFENVLVFYGIEKVRKEYLNKSNTLNLTNYLIPKKKKQYISPFKKFKKILHAEQPKYIIIHSSELIIPAIRFAKKKNCSVIYAEHEPNHTKTKLEKFLTKYAIKYADAIVCLNKSYKNSFPTKNKVAIIPNGVNHLIFTPNLSQRNNDLHVLGIAARITDTKDHANLLIAFSKVLKKYPNNVLKIAGNGDLLKETKELAAKLNILSQTKFVGLLDERELINFYHSIDIYVHATKSETLSTAILQAMSCGLPVITSNIENNVSLILENKTGWLYEDQNALDLTNKIIHTIENPEKAKEIGSNARESVVLNYSLQNMGRLYTELLRNT